MRSRVYATVGRASVRLSVPSFDSSSGGRRICCWAVCRQSKIRRPPLLLLLHEKKHFYRWRCERAMRTSCAEKWTQASNPMFSPKRNSIFASRKCNAVVVYISQLTSTAAVYRLQNRQLTFATYGAPALIDINWTNRFLPGVYSPLAYSLAYCIAYVVKKSSHSIHDRRSKRLISLSTFCDMSCLTMKNTVACTAAWVFFKLFSHLFWEWYTIKLTDLVTNTALA